MTKQSDKYITVDGVRFDITNGRALPAHKQSQAPAGRSAVLDLRAPKSSAVQEYVSSQQQTLKPAAQVQAAKSKPITKRQARKKIKHDQPKLKPTLVQRVAEIEFSSFVLARSFWPKPNFSLWQLSLLRTLASPQTWLLLTLPLIFLQVRVLKHLTLNETLQSTKAFIAPDHYQAIIWALGFALAAFLIGVIIRSSITASGVYVRLRELDSRPVKILQAMRAAMHSLLRQSLNYVVHFAIIIGLSLLFLWGAITLLGSTNLWITTNKYQLVVALGFVWLAVIILLYSKHWLQIGLLARSSKVRHLQWQSLKLLFVSLPRNLITGTLGLTLLCAVYGAIVLMSWQLTSYFIGLSSGPAIGILIAEAVIIIVLLTALQYLQQNIWARQYYYVASHSADSTELLYMQRQKPESLWPLAVALGLASLLLLGYILLVSLSASRMRGFLANIHASIPDKVQLVVPIKR